MKTISLTPDQARFVDEQVARGRFESADEVVSAGLDLLSETVSEADLESTRRKIAEGLAAAEAGQLVDGHLAIQQIRQRIIDQSAGRPG